MHTPANNVINALNLWERMTSIKRHPRGQRGPKGNVVFVTDVYANKTLLPTPHERPIMSRHWPPLSNNGVLRPHWSILAYGTQKQRSLTIIAVAGDRSSMYSSVASGKQEKGE